MSSPYRDTDNTPPAPLEELRWRRRIGKSAGWAALLLLGEMVLLVATGLLSARFALAGALAWLAVGIGAGVATWMLTARRPGGRMGLWGWLPRGSVPAYVAVTCLLLLGIHSQVASYAAGALLVVTAFAHLVRFARPQKRRRGRGVLWWALLVWLMLEHFAPLVNMPLWRDWGIVFLLLAAASFEGLRRALLPVDHQWWFDGRMEPPSEWVSLLVYRDRQAEVLCIDEMLGSFWTEGEALEWLTENGYLPAERALAEHLVDGVPPDVLPMPRRRKRLRAAATPQEPRLRVASDSTAADAPDEAADELDENAALDEPEPPRAVAVHDPRDPRP